MIYKDFAELFKSRRSGKDIKPFYNQYYGLIEDGADIVLVERRFHLPAKGTAVRTEDVPARRPLARIRPDDTMEILRDVSSYDMAGKNVLARTLPWGFGFASATNIHGLKSPKSGQVRLVKWGFRSRSEKPETNSWPVGQGVKLCLRTGGIVPGTALPDTITRVDRTKSAPVYKYADRLIKTIDLLLPMGALETSYADMARSAGVTKDVYWIPFDGATHNIEPTDENLVLYAACVAASYPTLKHFKTSWNSALQFRRTLNDESGLRKYYAGRPLLRRQLIKLLKPRFEGSTYEVDRATGARVVPVTQPSPEPATTE